MAKVYDVPADELISKLTEVLKSEEIDIPTWAVFVKTGAHADKPPQKPDCGIHDALQYCERSISTVLFL